MRGLGKGVEFQAQGLYGGGVTVSGPRVTRSNRGWDRDRVSYPLGASLVRSKGWSGFPSLAGHPWARRLTPLSPFCLPTPPCFLPSFSRCPPDPGQGLMPFELPGGRGGTWPCEIQHQLLGFAEPTLAGRHRSKASPFLGTCLLPASSPVMSRFL